MLLILSIILGGIGDRMYGAGEEFSPFSKTLGLLTMTAAIYSITQSFYLTIIGAAGHYVYRQGAGWGAYFVDDIDFNLAQEFKPYFLDQRKKEVAWIDWIIVRVFPKSYLKQNILARFIRSQFILLPFLVIAAWKPSFEAILFGEACAFWITAGYVLFPFIAFKIGRKDPENAPFDQTCYAELWSGSWFVFLYLMAIVV